MKIRCEYCGSYLSDTDEACPSCGAPNEHLVRGAAGQPKTIEELRAFAQKHDLPLEKMRFFLGEDCREPRAFGIYRETNGDFVVYKNKSDGQRAVRYRGKDEAFAVNELWQKMRSEEQQRKQAQQTRYAPSPSSAPQRRSRRRLLPVVLVFMVLPLIMIAVLTLQVLVRDGTPSWQRGYYAYDGGYYYRGGAESWYYYDDDTEDWTVADLDPSSPLYTDAGDYWQGSGYTEGAGYGDFRDSEYYSPGSSWSSSDDDDDWDDSDWDWDSGSDWDSGDTDWDSDW